MIELAYTSTTSWMYSRSDLDDILATSRRNNAASAITGLLLYRGMTVLQLLEGPPDAVHALYAKLLKDPRHHSLVKLYERPLQERNFAQWSMAFEPLSEAPLPEGVHRLTATSLDPDLALSPERRQLVDRFVQSVR